MDFYFTVIGATVHVLVLLWLLFGPNTDRPFEKLFPGKGKIARGFLLACMIGTTILLVFTFFKR